MEPTSPFAIPTACASAPQPAADDGPRFARFIGGSLMALGVALALLFVDLPPPAAALLGIASLTPMGARVLDETEGALPWWMIGAAGVVVACSALAFAR